MPKMRMPTFISPSGSTDAAAAFEAASNDEANEEPPAKRNSIADYRALGKKAGEAIERYEGEVVDEAGEKEEDKKNEERKEIIPKKKLLGGLISYTPASKEVKPKTRALTKEEKKWEAQQKKEAVAEAKRQARMKAAASRAMEKGGGIKKDDKLVRRGVFTMLHQKKSEQKEEEVGARSLLQKMRWGKAGIQTKGFVAITHVDDIDDAELARSRHPLMPGDVGFRVEFKAKDPILYGECAFKMRSAEYDTAEHALRLQEPIRSSVTIRFRLEPEGCHVAHNKPLSAIHLGGPVELAILHRVSARSNGYNAFMQVILNDTTLSARYTPTTLDSVTLRILVPDKAMHVGVNILYMQMLAGATPFSYLVSRIRLQSCASKQKKSNPTQHEVSDVLTKYADFDFTAPPQLPVGTAKHKKDKKAKKKKGLAAIVSEPGPETDDGGDGERPSTAG